MIRHIVAFRFKAQDFPGRADAAQRLREALEPLELTVPGVLTLEFGADDRSNPTHWDAALITQHETWEALAFYQTHPDHQAALAVVNEWVSDKAIVDYEWES